MCNWWQAGTGQCDHGQRTRNWKRYQGDRARQEAGGCKSHVWQLQRSFVDRAGFWEAEQMAPHNATEAADA